MCCWSGSRLIATGLTVFAYGAWQQADYLPILLVGLVITGIGLGCTLTPLSGAAVQTLKPHEVARGSTLLSVNQHVAVAVGTAMIANRAGARLGRCTNRSAPPRAAPMPHRTVEG